MGTNEQWYMCNLWSRFYSPVPVGPDMRLVGWAFRIDSMLLSSQNPYHGSSRRKLSDYQCATHRRWLGTPGQLVLFQGTTSQFLAMATLISIWFLSPIAVSAVATIILRKRQLVSGAQYVFAGIIHVSGTF